MNAVTPLDQTRLEAFEKRFIRALNESGMLLMTSIGHRTGLFDHLADGNAVTCEQLSQSTGLDSRYVREWLGAMVAGRILDIDPDTDSYWLPSEHAALLSRGGDANLATFSQYLSVLGSVEDDVVQCFHEGGGVPYSR